MAAEIKSDLYMSGQNLQTLLSQQGSQAPPNPIVVFSYLMLKLGVEPGKMLVWNGAWRNYGNKILLLRVGLL